MANYATAYEALEALGSTKEEVYQSIKGLGFAVTMSDQHQSNTCLVARYLHGVGFPNARITINYFWEEDDGIYSWDSGPGRLAPPQVTDFIWAVNIDGQYQDLIVSEEEQK